MTSHRGLFPGLVFVIACAVTQAPLADDYTLGLQALEAGNAALTIEVWRPLAESGDVEAQFGLGVMYNDGLGVEQDYEEANYWFLRAAEQGHAPSQFNLGNAYKNGTGMAPAPGMAVHWWRKAAEQDFGPAQFNLGSALLEGHGIARDRAAAMQWYRRAAANGHPTAQQNLDALAENAEAQGSPKPARMTTAPAVESNVESPPPTSGDDATAIPAHDDAHRSARPAPPIERPTTASQASTDHAEDAAKFAPQECDAWLDGDALPFTLQLLSSRAQADVGAYARQHALTNTATCSYLVGGRRWHALLLGRFPSATAARAALAELPEAVRADGGFVRRVSEIRTAVAASR